MELSKNNKVNTIFFIAIIGMIASIGYLFYVSDQETKVEKPSHLAYSSKHGAVLGTKNYLFHTNQAGQLLNHYNVEELGLSSFISDMVISDDSLYIADAKTHDIFKCDFPLKSCRPFALVQNLHGVEPMKLAFSTDKEHFYVTSSSKHKIDYFDKNGLYLYTLPLHGKLKYPNGIVMAEDGTIIVADTNHHRVIGIKHHETDAKIVWKIPFSGVYSWPVYIALDKNNALWIAVLDGFLDKGKVLTSNDLITTMEIPSSPLKPKAIRGTDNGMLLSDVEKYSYLLTDFSAQNYQKFGDDIVQKKLQDFYEEKEFYEMQVSISQYLIGLSVLVLIIIAIYEYSTKQDKSSLFSSVAQDDDFSVYTPKSSTHVEGDSQGIVWLRLKPKIVKKIKFGAVFLGLSNIGLVVMFIYLGITETYPLLLLGTLVVIMGVISIFALKVLKQRVGVKDDNLYIEDLFGNINSDRVENTIFSGRRILVKQSAIGLYDGHGETLFDDDEFGSYILPILKRAKRNSELQIMIEKLTQGDRNSWLMLLLSIVLLIGTFMFIYVGGVF